MTADDSVAIHRARRKQQKLQAIRNASYKLRFIAVWLLLRFITAAHSIGIALIRALAPLLLGARKFIKRFLLGIILSSYFFVLKFKRRIQTLATSGRHKLLAWFNQYIYKLTIFIIILMTLLNNLAARKLNAEELQSQILFNAVAGDRDESPTELVEEGPLNGEARNGSLSYLDDNTLLSEEYALTPAAPDTDDDSFYAATEDDSAFIAPLITDVDQGLAQRDSIELYIVQPGDTVSSISLKFAVNINTILWQNNLDWNSTIRPGQILSILPTDGVAHAVKSGETLTQIAKKYQADLNTIIVHNKLADASDINIGEVLIIPNGIKPTAIVLRPRQPRDLPTVLHDIFSPSPYLDAGTQFLWPVISRRITQYFHLRHKGVDIGDKKGAPIYAAESGKVERAGWSRGFGYNVIINHGNGLKTLYGHASKLLVKANETVTRGQVIAQVGSTGWSTGPHVHFETHVNGRVSNPLNFIR